MIRVPRGAPPPLKVYTAKTVKLPNGSKVTRAQRELEESISFFTNPANYSNERKVTTETFPFKVYKDKDLTSELEKVFGKKCAYCESRFAHVTPKDIEHFRPKSEINTGQATLTPGYYWLAGEWENLLVSCPDCNRARAHPVPGLPDRVKLGKETQFPLADESRRVRRKGTLTDEEAVRLLLNPCVDDPEQHLEFDEQGLAHARADAHGAASPRGTASIAVYALQRKLLVEERQRVLNSLRAGLRQLEHLVWVHNELKTLGADAIKLNANANQIRGLRDQLRDMLASDAPYLAMLRGWLRGAKARGEFDTLIAFGIDPTTLIGP